MVPWDQFTARFHWKQGEHVALVGPTGQGKTNTAFWLLPKRKFVTVLATKPKDESLEKFGARNGYRVLDGKKRLFSSPTVIQQWRGLTAKKAPRRIVWPNARRLDSEALQRSTFQYVMADIYMRGGWTLYIDELWYVGNVLGMTHEVKKYLQQARSMKVSLVISSQRPAWIPVETFDQSSHLFFYRDSDETNLKRIAAIGWLNANTIRNAVARLPQYHVLYVNTRTGDMMVTKPPAPQE